MKRNGNKALGWLMLGVAAVSLSIGQVALAQPPGGPGGPGGPPGPGRGMRPMPVVEIPVSILAGALNLTEEQKNRIAAIQQEFQKERRALMPPPGEGDQRPDPETMRERMEQLHALGQKATQSIMALLTAQQKNALPGLIRELEALRITGIPLPVLGELNLTAEQKRQLRTLAERANQEMRRILETGRDSGDPESVRDAIRQLHERTRNQAMQILTEAQRAQVEAFLQEHPGPGPGGPPRGGRPGGRRP